LWGVAPQSKELDLSIYEEVAPQSRELDLPIYGEVAPQAPEGLRERA